MLGVCGSVSTEARNSVCVNIMNPIHANGSAFVGGFVRSLIVPGVDNRFRGRHTHSRLPRDTTNEAVVAARPGFVPRSTVRLSVRSGVRFEMELVSYINCVIPDTINCVRSRRPHVIRAP